MMQVSDWLSILAIVISVGTLIIQFAVEKKYHSKQKMLDEIYQLVYVKFPKKMDDFLKLKNISEQTVNEIKDFLCDDLKPVFSFIRFRNEQKYDEIKNCLSEIEDLSCSILNCDDTFKKRKEIENKIKHFFKVADKYFLFSK